MTYGPTDHSCGFWIIRDDCDGAECGAVPTRLYLAGYLCNEHAPDPARAAVAAPPMVPRPHGRGRNAFLAELAKMREQGGNA